MLQKLSHPSHLELYQIRDFLYHWLKSLFLSVLDFFPCSCDLRYKCTMPTGRKMCLVLILSGGSGSWFRTVVAVESRLLQSHKRGSRSFDATQGFSHPLLFWASLFLGPVVKVLLNHDVPGSRAGISHLWPQTPFSVSYESVIAWDAGDHVHGLQGWWDATWSSCFRRVSYTLASLCWVWWPGVLCTSAFKFLPWHLLMILCNIQHVSGPWFPLLWMRRQDNT